MSSRHKGKQASRGSKESHRPPDPHPYYPTSYPPDSQGSYQDEWPSTGEGGPEEDTVYNVQYNQAPADLSGGYTSEPPRSSSAYYANPAAIDRTEPQHSYAYEEHREAQSMASAPQASYSSAAYSTSSQYAATTGPYQPTYTVDSLSERFAGVQISSASGISHVNRNVVAAGEADAGLHPRYVRITQPTKFFKVGRVFKVLWTEPFAGNESEYDVEDELSYLSDTKFGGKAFSKVRRFVVVAERKGASWCIPLNTYRGEGATKRGINPADYAAVYPVGGRPKFRSEEKGKIIKDSFPIIVEDDNEKIDVMSRLNFSRVYTVEHNVKVLKVGRIAPSHLQLLKRYFLEGYQGDSEDEMAKMERNTSHEYGGSSRGQPTYSQQESNATAMQPHIAGDSVTNSQQFSTTQPYSSYQSVTYDIPHSSSQISGPYTPGHSDDNAQNDHLGYYNVASHADNQPSDDPHYQTTYSDLAKAQYSGRPQQRSATDYNSYHDPGYSEQAFLAAMASDTRKKKKKH